MNTSTACCICGYPFRVGERYLVYASNGYEGEPELWTNICTRTKSLANAANDVKVLGKGQVWERAGAKTSSNKSL